VLLAHVSVVCCRVLCFADARNVSWMKCDVIAGLLCAGVLMIWPHGMQP
jgi:hypothetical protein